MILKLLIVLGLTICIAQSAEENYCDPTLCDDGLTHTACDHYLEFAQDCGEDAEIVLMSAMHKKLILDLHNQFRSKIATGKVPGYAPAARMPVLRWNEDLAYVAGLHARSCTTDNDDCRNTRIFKNVGQNIGFDTITEPHNNVTAVIKRIFNAWHAEFKLGNQNNMKMLSPETLESMGRFTMMINDHAQDVGCALVRFTKDDLFYVYFTCNYSSNNHLGQRVYETGTACSNCISGCNRSLVGLCSHDEKINPNHYHEEQLRSFN